MIGEILLVVTRVFVCFWVCLYVTYPGRSCVLVMLVYVVLLSSQPGGGASGLDKGVNGLLGVRNRLSWRDSLICTLVDKSHLFLMFECLFVSEFV